MLSVEKAFAAEIKGVRARVARGAKLLDKKGPADWRKTLKRNLGKLDLGSGTACVLGWAYKAAVIDPDWSDGFETGTDALRVNASEYGFDMSHFDEPQHLGAFTEYDVLTEAWKEELRKPIPQAAKKTGIKKR